jgi:stalled ribosome rescue protein Dom34
MQYRFVLIDVIDKTVYGTNDVRIAENYAVLDCYMVIDSLTTSRMVGTEKLDIEELT